MGESFKVGQAPWEQAGNQTSFKVGEAPWEKKTIAYRETFPIRNEQHPDLSAKDRFLFKNLEVDPNQSLNFLKYTR